MFNISIIGTGFVADLYMRSLKTFPDINIIYAFDVNTPRLDAFCQYWNVSKADSLDDVLNQHNTTPKPDLILNLTNPGQHYQVSKSCLEAGLNVYSEKPLAILMEHAYELHQLASQRQLFLASAPCSYMSNVANTLNDAVQNGAIGKNRLVYAELDDDFITQAPYTKWLSESGAPWPYRDEFIVGCTLEHAGYYLTWLMRLYGSVEKVVAASAELIKPKLPDLESTAPDFSCAILFFSSGMITRITCGIVAPHNHQLMIIGDKGVIEVDECWNNNAKVKIRKRFAIRRKLVNSPFTSTYKISTKSHPTVSRKGAASMNFALGPYQVLKQIKKAEFINFYNDFALHLNEVTLAIQNSEKNLGIQIMKTKCPNFVTINWD